MSDKVYNVNNIQKQLAKKKGLSQYKPKEIDYMMRSSVGDAIYGKGPENSDIEDDASSEEYEANSDSELELESDDIHTNNMAIPKSKTKTHWSDRLQCKICGKSYMRSTVSRHKKTKYHQMYEEMNNKLRNILIDQTHIKKMKK